MSDKQFLSILTDIQRQRAVLMQEIGHLRSRNMHATAARAVSFYNWLGELAVKIGQIQENESPERLATMEGIRQSMMATWDRGAH